MFTFRHAFEHMQEAHEEALDLRLVQFITPQEAAAQGCSRLVLRDKHCDQTHAASTYTISPFTGQKYSKTVSFHMLG